MSIRLASWTLTFVDPVSPACWMLAGRTCTSATPDGCQSTLTPRKVSLSCLSASCWRIPMKRWCGGALRRQVCIHRRKASEPSTLEFYMSWFCFVLSHTNIIFVLQLWSASLCRTLRGESWTCCWWTHHPGRLMNICQYWRTLKNTPRWMEPFWSLRLRYQESGEMSHS